MSQEDTRNEAYDRKTCLDKLNQQPSRKVEVHPSGSDGLIDTSRSGLLREAVMICGSCKKKKKKTERQHITVCLVLKVHLHLKTYCLSFTVQFKPDEVGKLFWCELLSFSISLQRCLPSLQYKHVQHSACGAQSAKKKKKIIRVPLFSSQRAKIYYQ